ncbi:MAG: hypothetical protein JWR69_3316 [Pedosphaera sp.]|nr:hypothetical protein [Pedosphaera sp.]
MKSKFIRASASKSSGSVIYVMSPATRQLSWAGINLTLLCQFTRQLITGSRGSASLVPVNHTNRQSPVRRLWIAVLAVCLLGAAANVRAATGQVSVLRASAPGLDAKHLWALGMLETGNNDREIGGAGEISRYQILPAVWKSYSGSESYRDPEVSLQIARMHWNVLATSFQARSGRQPDDFDMYVLWNTGCGYYAKKGFSPSRIAPSVQDRAQRFVNLVNRK